MFLYMTFATILNELIIFTGDTEKHFQSNRQIKWVIKLLEDNISPGGQNSLLFQPFF